MNTDTGQYLPMREDTDAERRRIARELATTDDKIVVVHGTKAQLDDLSSAVKIGRAEQANRRARRKQQKDSRRDNRGH